MAIPAREFGSAVMIGEEAAWGTEQATRSNALRLLAWAVERKDIFEPRNHLGTNGATSTNSRNHYKRAIEVGGSFRTEAAYDDSTAMLLKYAFGAVATAGSGPYTHTYTAEVPRDSGLKGLSLEGLLGEQDAEIYLGCLFDSWRFRARAGEIAEFEWTLIGQTTDAETPSSQGSPTFSSNGEVMRFDHAGVFNFASANHTLVDIEFGMDKGMDRRMLLGSQTTAEPAPNGKLVIPVRMTVEYGVQAGMWAAYRAGTQGDATITFTGSGNNSAAFTLQNMYITNIGRQISGGAGIIRQTVDAVCESDGTDEGIKLVLTNDNSTPETN